MMTAMTTAPTEQSTTESLTGLAIERARIAISVVRSIAPSLGCRSDISVRSLETALLRHYVTKGEHALSLSGGAAVRAPFFSEKEVGALHECSVR